MLRKIEYLNKVMCENYEEYCRNSEDGKGDGMTFREYVEREAENDPNFWLWLYGGDEDNIPAKEQRLEDFEELINY